MKPALRPGDKIEPGEARRLHVHKKHGLHVLFRCADCRIRQVVKGESRQHANSEAAAAGWVRRNRGYVCGACRSPSNTPKLKYGQMRLAK